MTSTIPADKTARDDLAAKFVGSALGIEGGAA